MVIFSQGIRLPLPREGNMTISLTDTRSASLCQTQHPDVAIVRTDSLPIATCCDKASGMPVGDAMRREWVHANTTTKAGGYTNRNAGFIRRSGGGIRMRPARIIAAE
jgi:hypothetical protein